MNPNGFGDPLTFPVALPAGQSWHISCEIPLHRLNGFAQACTDIHGSRKSNPTDFGDPWIFSLA